MRFGTASGLKFQLPRARLSSFPFARIGAMAERYGIGHTLEQLGIMVAHLNTGDLGRLSATCSFIRGHRHVMWRRIVAMEVASRGLNHALLFLHEEWDEVYVGNNVLTWDGSSVSRVDGPSQ